MNASFALWMPVLTVIAAYLLGSIAFAILVSRAMGLSDPRTFGSRNPGATNVLRSGKRSAAIATLVLDALKGYAPVVLMLQMASAWGVAGTASEWAALAGLAAFLGHLYPVFFRFKGGKGVATAVGVLFGLEPTLGLACLGTFLILVYFSRFVSLASVVAVDDLEQAIAVANDSDFGLSAAVLTHNVQWGFTAAKQIRAGSVHIGMHSFQSNALAPIGGYGMSGIGRSGGKYSTEEFTELKWVSLALEEQ